tara:strand:+ start:2282 stop:4777 length:2496 start_codon:yes stop_codon:yes gene_type:complete
MNMNQRLLMRLLMIGTLALVWSSCARTSAQFRRCDTSADCNASEVCEDNVCTEADGVGGMGVPECLVNTDCDDGDPCNGEETCNEETCEAGTAVNCSDGDVCNGEETCDPDTGTCLAGENPCDSTDATDICVPTDSDTGYACQEVACLTHDDCSGDTPYCNEANECVACLSDADCDDGALCNGEEVCNANSTCEAGTPVACSDGDACNGEETCDPNTGACLSGSDPCLATSAIDICEPTDSETGYVCQEVSCLSDADCDGDTPYCDAQNECVACLVDTHCDDGAPCNGGETCNADNTCEAGTPVTCSDGDACNGEETCDATTGACLSGTDPCLATAAIDICEPADNSNGYVCQEVTCTEDSHCDDGNLCTTGETCNLETNLCNAGDLVVCADEDPCNGEETCVPETGECIDGTSPCADGETCLSEDSDDGYFCAAYGVNELVAGGDKTCAITLEGDLYCWGSNVDGEIRYNGNSILHTPELVAQNVLDAAIGRVPDQESGNHLCYIRDTSGTQEIVCSGSQWWGMLGDGVDLDVLSENTTTATINNAYFSGDFVAIDAGVAHTCVGTSTGAVYCWGMAFSGQTGNWVNPSTSSGGQATPLSVSGLPANKQVIDVATGGYHSCAVMADAGVAHGDLYCWGLNENGQLGTSGAGDSNCLDSETLDDVGCYVTPQKVNFPGAVAGISQVCGGKDYTCAITEPDGTLYCWGDYTQSGGDNPLVAPAGASVALDVQQVSCGLFHVCALGGHGQVSCFGNNNYGEGQSSLSYASLGDDFAPTVVAAGAYHTCMAGALANSVYCWGDNALGQLGICSNIGTFNAPQETALLDVCPEQP